MSDSTNKPLFQTPNWRALTEALIYMMERKDPYTRGHSQRVQAGGKLLANALAERDRQTWDAYYRECNSIACLFHDIGKLVVDKSTLLHQGPVLSPEQRHELDDHPYEGAVIIRKLFPIEVVLGILHHHERWDGRTEGPLYGYPFGLSGTSIPPISRVIKICDTFDAMTTQRPYNTPLPKEVAVQRILDEAGKQFDPDYAKIFVDEVVSQI